MSFGVSLGMSRVRINRGDTYIPKLAVCLLNGVGMGLCLLGAPCISFAPPMIKSRRCRFGSGYGLDVRLTGSTCKGTWPSAHAHSMWVVSRAVEFSAPVCDPRIIAN